MEDASPGSIKGILITLTVDSPKKRFLDLKEVAQRHRDITDSPQFAIAGDMALLQVIEDMPDTNDVAKAAANYWRLKGAVSYMDTLSRLGDTKPNKTKITDSGNMDHTV